MALFTAIDDNVIIAVYGGVGGFGIKPLNPPTTGVGTVYGIGGTVYNFTIGDRVGFVTSAYFATDDSPLSYAVVPKTDIRVII